MYSSTLSILLAVLSTATATAVNPIQRKGQSECPEMLDPYIVEAGNMTINLPPILHIFEGTHHERGYIAGHGEIEVDINIIIITLDMNVTVSVPNLAFYFQEVSGEGGYVDVLPFTSFPSGNFTPLGEPALIHLQNFKAQWNVQFVINIIGNRLNIRTLNVMELSFDGLCLNLGDVSIGGEQIDWEDFCANFKHRFDAEWNNLSLRDQLIERIKVASNAYVSYTALEFVEWLCNPCNVIDTNLPC